MTRNANKLDDLAPDPLPSKRTIWGLNGLLFFISDVRHGVGPLLSIYLQKDLRWNPSWIGFTLAIIDLSSVISQLPAGLIVDASKCKRALIAFSCFFIIFGCAFILTSPNYMTLILAQFLMGIAFAFIAPTLGSITLGLFGRHQYPKRTSKNEMWNHAGNILTAASIGILSYFYGHQWIFYTVILFATISLMCLGFINPLEINYRRARELPESLNPQESPLPLWDLLKKKPILIFNLSLVLYYLSNAAQMNLVGQVLVRRYPDHDSLYLSTLMIIAELVMFLTAFGMGFVVNRIGRKAILLTAFLILPTRSILYTLVENPFYLLSLQIFDGLAAGMIGVIGTVINSDLAKGTGRFNFLQGLSALSVGFGASLSNVMAGLIATFFGFNASFFGLAIVAILGGSFFYLYMPETREE